MGTRGPQPGSGGRPKKSLADKVLDGNPGHRPLEIVKFPAAADLKGADMPPPKEYLADVQKDGDSTIAVVIYENTWKWLNERGCAHFVPMEVLEHYAQTVGRWVQVERAITQYGFLGKHPTTGAPIPSPFVAIAQNYMKQANNLWMTIFQTVKENCSTPFEGNSPQDDVMERLLRSRRG